MLKRGDYLGILIALGMLWESNNWTPIDGGPKDSEWLLKMASTGVR